MKKNRKAKNMLMFVSTAFLFLFLLRCKTKERCPAYGYYSYNNVKQNFSEVNSELPVFTLSYSYQDFKEMRDAGLCEIAGYAKCEMKEF